MTAAPRRSVVADPARDTAWTTQARCRKKDPELWFPVGYTTAKDRAQVEEAKAECRKCPVMAACLAWARATNQLDGIYGGLTPAQRRDRGQKPIEHGTYRGYGTHLKRREIACADCLAAKVAYQKRRKYRKRKEAMAS